MPRAAKKQPTKRATSKARAKASRTNGAKGGRKPDKLPAVVLKRIGQPPDDAAGLRTWNAKLLAEIQWLAINGKIQPELAASIRANAGALERVLPPAPPPRPRDDDDDDPDDGEVSGAELEDSTPDGSLRIDH